MVGHGGSATEEASIYDDESTAGKGVVRIAAVAALGGFLFGYDTAVIGSVLDFIPYKLGDFWTGYLVAGASLGAAVGGVGRGDPGRVGWIPLGPREPYYPPYRVSQTYVRNVNVSNVTNVTVYRQGPGGQRPPLANRAAATLVPAAAMVGSRNVASLAEPVPQGAFQPGGVLRGAAPVMPNRGTLGVTPAVARQLRLPPHDRQLGPGQPAFPGASIRHRRLQAGRRPDRHGRARVARAARRAAFPANGCRRRVPLFQRDPDP